MDLSSIADMALLALFENQLNDIGADTSIASFSEWSKICFDEISVLCNPQETIKSSEKNKVIIFMQKITNKCFLVNQKTNKISVKNNIDKEDLFELNQLILAGEDVDIPNPKGSTLIHLAAMVGNEQMIRKLILLGADYNSVGGGKSPLYIAAGEGHLEAVRYLIIAGANINDRQNNGKTAVDIAQEKGHKKVVSLLRLSMIR